MLKICLKSLKEVKYYKVIKILKSLQLTAKVYYLQPKRAPIRESFCEYSLKLTIFVIKAPTKVFYWVRIFQDETKNCKMSWLLQRVAFPVVSHYNKDWKKAKLVQQKVI